MAKRIDDPFADIGAAEDDPFADIGATSPLGQAVARSALDVAKQIPAGLAAGVAAIPAFPAQAAGLIGGIASPYIEKAVEAVPSWLGGGPEKVAEMRALDEQRRSRMAAAQKIGAADQWLPAPETTAGQFARTGAEFVPALVTGGARALAPGQTIAEYAAREAVPAARRAGVGATAGLTSEAARQATEGTAAEPFAAIGGAVVGGVGAARAAERAAAKSALTVFKDQVGPEAAALYDQFRASGFQLSPRAAPILADSLQPALARQGLTETTAEQTFKVLDKWKQKPFIEPQDFQDAYKELGAVAKAAARTNPSDQLAANIAQENLLHFLETIDPKLVAQQGVISVAPGGAATTSTANAAALLQEANANWAAKMRSEAVSGRITKAEQVASGQFSGLGLENELRRRIGVLGLPAKEGGMRGATEAERAVFKQFGEGTAGQNLRRYLTGALSGRGGIGVGGLFLGGGGLASYLGADPLVSGGLATGAPALGVTLAMLGNRSARARALDIERQLLSRAPLAAGRIPRAQSSLPLTLAPPTLATIGEPQYTAEGYPYYQGSP